MSFVIHRKKKSPNYDPVKITVEFLVIHYTATSLSRALALFQDSSSKVSSHLVIDRDGDVYELVSCLDGSCFKAWHAGDSYWQAEEKNWKQFNDFAIGVELVNKNGNLFEYTTQQYHSLKVLMEKLKKHYTALENPERILGHEHIAGHRGKVDPGHCFNWPLFFQMSYSGEIPLRKAVLPDKQRQMFLDIYQTLIRNKEQKGKTFDVKTRAIYKDYLSSLITDEDWMQLNHQMEKSLTSYF
ncbi:MAG: N-acetylmuramoyl-L-alanine amidase [Bdellovibrionales bacterium]|nr:N-acetylmuramoyl-L-alanine amidase [Bdellovibrionales bacterium]